MILLSVCIVLYMKKSMRKWYHLYQ
ncbi:unnamed protein product [Oppiella nova]|uniref:Uncharacterized protein n=1 Tax=Oppiella nova TaxID=334625 RepID=A0A7R9R247_9ACAR|nr:unnamed protein product [Oppiella nova]CAG2182810.1 unnamed protein product [Oppiella nova]